MSFPAHITGKKPTELHRTSSAIGGTGRVPHAKRPRSRPPTSLRDKVAFLQGHLPTSSGPYSVGTMDIEVPAQSPRTFSNIKRNDQHLLQLETVLFTLYYPAAFGSGSGKDPAGYKRWSRETWLPRPRIQMAKGYGRFADIPDSVAIGWFATTTMLTKLRAYRNSLPATHWPPEGNYKRDGYRIKNRRGPPPAGASDEPKFPLLFFSHGLGGNRTAYSSMCSEFASYGFVVCALEHRDGSGPRTFVNHSRHENEASLQEQGGLGGTGHTEKHATKGYDQVDYIFPKDNPRDTDPGNEKGVDAELRAAQIDLRMAEIEEAYRVMKDICMGKGEQIAQKNLRRKGYVGSSSRGLEGVDWSAWTNRFHVDKVTVAGHSFGAATVVEVLRHRDDRFRNVQAGIIYDIWGAPIKPPKLDPSHKIHVPLLGINSEAFMYWQSNFDAVMSLMKEATEQAMVHPQRAIDLNVSASLEFLRDVTEGAGRSIIKRCMTDEKLLHTDMLDQVPDAQKPDEEYIAARLKVQNEFRTRAAARFQRKLKRKKKHGFYNPGDEVWMHFKPGIEDLVNWRDETFGAKDEVQYDNSERSEDSRLEREEETLEEEAIDSQGQNWLGQPPSLQDEALQQ